MIFSSIGFSLAVIPNELPTLLSIVYSNIPPVKLGKFEIVKKHTFWKQHNKFFKFEKIVGADSKLGFGFRLGPHADFQTIIELGPQEKTKPLGLDGNQLKRQSSKRIVTVNDSKLKEEEIVSESDNNITKKQVSRALNRTSAKKNHRPYIGKIEFKKVPGIDDVKTDKSQKKINTLKSPKVGKFSTDAAPTRFVIL